MLQDPGRGRGPKKGHQVTMWLEQSITSWVLTDPTHFHESPSN